MARSPNYPGIGLPDAIDRIRQIHLKAHTHKADAETMAKAAGYNGINGAALTMLSALKKYDLLEEVGKELKVSQLAMTIIADPMASKERRAAIQRAAFSPALFDDIRKQYPGSVPSDDIVRSYLLKKGFIASAVDGAIRAFRETMSLVTDEGLGYSAAESDGLNADEESDQPPKDQPKVEVGDLVQWESGGVLSFEKPRLVRAIQEHDSAQWVFVDGSETGIPMNEVIIEQKGNKLPATPPTLAFAAPTINSQLRTLMDSEREWLRGPLSKDISYRLIVSGEMGPREIGRLIKLLEAQKAVLSEEDGSDLA